jgi:hypothetical protein
MFVSDVLYQFEWIYCFSASKKNYGPRFHANGIFIVGRSRSDDYDLKTISSFTVYKYDCTEKSSAPNLFPKSIDKNKNHDFDANV